MHERSDKAWRKAYARLEELERSILPPGEGLDGFHEALNSARVAESKGVLMYSRVSQWTLDAKVRLTEAKLLYLSKKRALRARATLAYSDQEDVLAPYAEKVARRDLEHQRLRAYLDCIDRLLSNVKHFREDLSKKLKVIEIERQVAGES